MATIEINGADEATVGPIRDALKAAALASPGLTGTPTAPTPAGATDSTQIATTAFVQALINALSLTIGGGDLLAANNLSDVADAAAARANLGAAALAVAQTFGAVQTFGAQVALGVVTLADGANIAWDAAAGNLASVTLGGDRQLNNPTNIAPGSYVVRVTQDATGTRLLSFGSDFRFPGGSPPELSAGANAVDILTFLNVGGADLYLVAQADFQAPA